MKASVAKLVVVVSIVALSAACGGTADDGVATGGDDSAIADTGSSGGTGDGGDTGGTGVDADLHPALITARPYAMLVPASYDGSPMPLILTLHGLGSYGLQQAQLSGLLDAAEDRGFLLAYPDGVAVFGYRAWNASCCDSIGNSTDDVAYLRAVIADASDRYNVDQKKIYVHGFSNGAFMAHLLGCVAADRIAAIAPYAGTMWSDEEAVCDPQQPLAVLHTHGTADTTVYYDGGFYSFSGQAVYYLSASAVVSRWQQLNDCQPIPVTQVFNVDLNLLGDETTVDSYPCTDGMTVELWTINGGGHGAFMSDAYRDAVIDFLYAHPKP